MTSFTLDQGKVAGAALLLSFLSIVVGLPSPGGETGMPLRDRSATASPPPGPTRCGPGAHR